MYTNCILERCFGLDYYNSLQFVFNQSWGISPLSAFRSDAFNKIIRRCLQKNPAQRPSMNQLKSVRFLTFS